MLLYYYITYLLLIPCGRYVHAMSRSVIHKDRHAAHRTSILNLL